MVPDNWTKIELGDASKMEKGVTYSAKHYAEKGAGYPFITIKCIQKGGGFNWRGLKYYAGPYKQSQLINSGDLLIAATDLTRNGDIIGSPIRVPIFEKSKSILMSMDICRIDSDSRLLFPDFLYHQLMSEKSRQFMKANSAGSTVLHLNSKSIPKMKIALPPLPEQKKIATILNSVDDTIQATQAVIDQTSKVKQGLLQQLLTRGIGHTRFKQTEIGVIPEDWESIPFNQVLDVRSGKGFRLDEYIDEGLKLLRIDNVSWGKITWESIAYLPTHYADEYSELLLKEGDILLALNRPITQGKLKLAILKRDDSPAILYQRVGKILFKNGGVINNFAYHLLNYSLPPFIMEKSVGSDQPFINITALRKLKLPIPTLNEQRKIASILDENDECIETHNTYLEHLFNLKRGLMQDLLTGRVRVKPDEVNTT